MANRYLRREPGFYKRLWKLSLPMILQNLITFSLGLIDTFMVSQLGNEEMAAVTTANVPVFLLISIVFGVQSGLGILVSQYWGKSDIKNINRAIGVSCLIGSSITLVLGDKTYRVRKGDSFSYKPSVTHYLKNTGKTPASVIWVCTPPNF